MSKCPICAKEPLVCRECQGILAQNDRVICVEGSLHFCSQDCMCNFYDGIKVRAIPEQHGQPDTSSKLEQEFRRQEHADA